MKRHHVLGVARVAALHTVEKPSVYFVDLADHSLEDFLCGGRFSNSLLTLVPEARKLVAPGLAELFADPFDEVQVLSIGVRFRILSFLREINETWIVLSQ